MLRGIKPAAIALGAAVLLAGCFGDTEVESTGTPTRDVRELARDELADGGDLSIGVEGLPQTLNPWHIDAAFSNAERVLAPTVGGAVAVRADGSWEVNELYAESVDVIEADPLTVRVVLNPEAVWQDGSSITAADMSAFVAAMGDDDLRAIRHPAFADIAEVSSDDEFSYDVVFDSVTADWPAVIYPGLPESVSSDADVFNENFTDAAIPSNGPFVVSEVDREDGRLVLEPNPRWWGPAPQLDSIVWRNAPADVQADAFLAGELNVASVDSQNREALAEEHDLLQVVSRDWIHVTINSSRGALTEDPVRRAIANSIDRQAIADDIAVRFAADVPLTDSLVYVPVQRWVSRWRCR